MGKVVQARLDDDCVKELQRAVRKLGCTESEVIRQAIKLFSRCACAPAVKRISGAGKFSSGISDLGSNKEHLKGFGR